MAKSLNELTRGAVFYAVPAVGACVATPREALWGVGICLGVFLIRPLRPYAAALAAAFGLLVLGRLGLAVANQGAVAVTLGIVLVGALAWSASLWRRRDATTSQAPRVLAAVAVATAVAAAAAGVVTHRYTLSLSLVSLTPFLVAVTAQLKPAPWLQTVKALAVGLALLTVRIGVAYGFAEGSALALSAGRPAEAFHEAGLAIKLGAEGRVQLTRLEGAALAATPVQDLERMYAERDPRTSPRLFDVVMARATFAAGDYEKAATYAALATSAGPVHVTKTEHYPLDSLMQELAGGSSSPKTLGYTALWGGRFDDAAAAFGKESTPEGRRMRALALERGGHADEARAAFLPLWEAEEPDMEAGFGLLRLEGAVTGRRNQLWAEMGKRWPDVIVGSDLNTADGYKLTKNRMSLGRSPATFPYEGAGRRRIVIIAESFPLYGLAPIVTLTLDDEPVHTFYMDVPGEHLYTVVATLPPGEHVFALLYENDYVNADESADRNVFVREVRLGPE